MPYSTSEMYAVRSQEFIAPYHSNRGIPPTIGIRSNWLIRSKASPEANCSVHDSLCGAYMVAGFTALVVYEVVGDICAPAKSIVEIDPSTYNP